MAEDKSYLNVPLGLPPTPGDIRRSQPEQEPAKPLSSLFGGAWEDTASYAALLRWWETPDHEDPDFFVTEEMLEMQTKGLPTQYVEEVANSTNEAQFMMRVRSIKERLKTREELGKHGFSGMAMNFGAAMLDPTFLVAAPVASIGILGKATQTGLATAKAVRATSAMRGLKLAGIVDVPIEIGRYAMDDMAELEHLFFNVAASATLSGGIGAAFPTTTGFSKGWKKQVELERRRIAAEIFENAAESSRGSTTGLAQQMTDTHNLRAMADKMGVGTGKIENGQASFKSNDELRIDIENKLADDMGIDRSLYSSRQGETTITRDGVTIKLKSREELRETIDVELSKQNNKAAAEVSELDDAQVVKQAEESGIPTTTTSKAEATPVPKTHDEVGGSSGKAMKNAKPRYSQSSETTFGDDIDKSIFAGGKGTNISASQKRHREFVMNALGITEGQFIALREALLKANKSGYTKGKPIAISRSNIPNLQDFTGSSGSKAAPKPKDVVKARPIEDIRKDLVKERSKGDFSGDVNNLDRKSLLHQAKENGVETHRVNENGKKVFRKADDIRKDLIEKKMEEASIRGQAKTAIRQSVEETVEGVDADGKFFNFTPDEWAEELAKPAAERGWVSELFSRIPFLRPWAVTASRSQNKNLRSMMSIFVEDPTLGPKRDVETAVDMNSQIAVQRFMEKRMAIHRTGGDEALKQFDESVARAIRTGEDMAGMAGEAAAEIRSFFKQMADYGANSGIEALKNMTRNPNYIPREAKKIAVMMARDVYGDDAVLDFLERALKRGDPEMDPKKIKATARGWMTYASDPEGYTNARVTSSQKNAKRLAAMEEALRKGGVDGDDLEEIMDLFIPKSQDAHLGSTNRRINFDEGFSMEMENGDVLDFSMLLENNMQYLMDKHARRVIGAAEITKTSKALGIEASGTGTVPTIDDMIKWLKKGGDLTETEMKGFMVTYRHIMGLGQEDLINIPGSRSVMQTLSDYAFINSMGNVGIAQIPEFYNSAASNGLVAALQTIPALRRLTRNARTGEIEDTVMQQMAELSAVGEMLHKSHSIRHKTQEAMGVTPGSGGRVARGMDLARDVVSGTKQVKIGKYHVPFNPLGIAPMDEALRMGHVRATMQNWVNTAFTVKNGKPVKNSFFNKSRDRFKDLGFTDTEIDELMEELANPNVVETVPGMVTGRKIVNLNFDNMDPKLKMKLQFALRRDTDRVIQRNKIGNLPYWMNTPTGALLTQFRKFAINATQKQLAYNMKHNDMKAFNTLIGTCVVGYLGYVTNVYISSTKYEGRERKEFLENAFGEKEFMGVKIPGGNNTIAAITRSGASGIVPALIDPVAGMISPEEETLLNPYFRTSGYNVSPLSGIPAYALVTGGVSSGSDLVRGGLYALTGGVAGEQYDRKKMQRLIRLGPMRNNVLMNQLLREFTDLIPED